MSGSNQFPRYVYFNIYADELQFQYQKMTFFDIIVFSIYKYCKWISNLNAIKIYKVINQTLIYAWEKFKDQIL